MAKVKYGDFEGKQVVKSGNYFKVAAYLKQSKNPILSPNNILEWYDNETGKRPDEDRSICGGMPTNLSKKDTKDVAIKLTTGEEFIAEFNGKEYQLFCKSQLKNTAKDDFGASSSAKRKHPLRTILISIAVIFFSLCVIVALLGGGGDATDSPADTQMTTEEMNLAFKQDILPKIKEAYHNYDTIIADQTTTFTSVANGGLDIYGAYQNLAVCADNYDNILSSEIDAPEYFTKEQKDQLRNVFLGLGTAANINKSFLEDIMSALDGGNIPPSLVNKAQDVGLQATAQLIDSQSNYQKLCSAFGVTDEEASIQ